MTEWNKIEVAFDNTPGIVDTGWIQVFPGITILTGRNNVGKSRVLRSIGGMAQFYAGQSPDEAVPKIRLTRDELCITADLRNLRPRSYLVERGGVAEVDGRWVTPPGNPPHFERSPGQAVQGAQQQRSSLRHLGLPYAEVMDAALASLVYFAPQRKLQVAAPTSPAAIPSPDGSDFGQVLYRHFNSARQYPELVRVLAGMFPEVENIFTSAEVAHSVTVKVRDRFADEDFSLDELGTGLGQLAHLVLSVLLQPPGRVLLVEEPTAYLHPGAETVLARFLNGHREHAYVIATHSPNFITAIAPDRVWLTTRDKAGTRLVPIVPAGTTSQVLGELGVEIGDVAIADRVLFVEGQVDGRIYPELLQILGWEATVVPMRGSAPALALDDVMRRLGATLGVDYLVCLDGDQKRPLPGDVRVAFIPFGEIEDLLLEDAGAIEAWLADRLGQLAEGESEVQSERTAAKWDQDTIRDFTASARAQGVKGAKILTDLADRAGLRYRKVADGPAIAARLAPDVVELIRPTLTPLFEPKR